MLYALTAVQLVHNFALSVEKKFMEASTVNLKCTKKIMCVIKTHKPSAHKKRIVQLPNMNEYHCQIIITSTCLIASYTR